MIKTTSFLLLSFLSNLGDSLFLSGLPLYFYYKNGNLIETSYVTIIITITILIFNKYIKKTLKKHPLMVTGAGELLMGVVGVIFLIAYVFYPSKYIILASVFPLAIIYNMYAPSKFLYIQKYFFEKNEFKYTAWQSSINTAEFLVGVMSSGYLLRFTASNLYSLSIF